MNVKTHWRYNWKLGKWDQLFLMSYESPSYAGPWYFPGGLMPQAVW